MKVAFFQPYLANWRIEYLEYFINKFEGEVVVYDGGFGGKNDTKSVSGNSAEFIFKKLFSFSPVFSFKGQSYPFYFSPFLLFHLLKDRPEVVITEGEINFINNISIFIYCKLCRKRYVWWSLGKVRTRKENVINKLLNPVVNFLLKNASCIMARNSLAKKYYDEKGIESNKVIVAPNSMNHHLALKDNDEDLTSSLFAKKSRKVMLYVGALTEQKRPIELIEAYSIAMKSGLDDLDLWFVGDGPEMPRLKERVLELGLESRVVFFGKIFKGVGNYFKASDFVVVPGLGGLVINHAMIFGKPVISRLADGTELDLVKNDVTGYLLEDYSNNTLANSIMEIVEGDKFIMMGENAKTLVNTEWNIEKMFARNLDCINFARKKQ
ncbi:glycosyltransferase family 4 protein [Pseudoalteromonas galatheae]|uniref:glycosyltransferase family 4 protein n=1 Tax=Pseudoalteromonas galatheae TaxID=579562 RepID=UPI0030CD8B18